MKYLFLFALFSTTINAKDSDYEAIAARLISSYQVIVDPMTDIELMTITVAESPNKYSSWGNQNLIEGLILTCSKNSQSIEISYRDDGLKINFDSVTIRIGKESPIELSIGSIYRPNKMFMIAHAKINLNSGVPYILSKIHKVEKVVVKLGSLNQDAPQAILKITSKSSILEAYKKCSSYS